MRNFQDTFETRKGSIISAFSIWMTVPLMDVLQHLENMSKSIYCVFVRLSGGNIV